VNSINWGRVLSQTIHFIYCYFRALETPGNFDTQVEIAVPTGACGNLSGKKLPTFEISNKYFIQSIAGMISHHMGFPIRLIASVNSNDLVHVLISEKTFCQKYEEVK